MNTIAEDKSVLDSNSKSNSLGLAAGDASRVSKKKARITRLNIAAVVNFRERFHLLFRV
jgi:hypothetical protein